MLLQKQKLHLRQKTHALHPIVIIGQHGLTPEVNAAIDEALNIHELIKIRVNADDRDARKAMIESILATHHADLVQSIGHIIAIYRERPEEQ